MSVSPTIGISRLSYKVTREQDVGIEGPNSNGISRLSYKVRREQVVGVVGPNSIGEANAQTVYKGRKLAFHITLFG